MSPTEPDFEVRLASDPQDVTSLHRLRYDVFVEELGGDGALVDHEARLERDRFDPFCEHMLLIDRNREAEAGGHVIGVYRLMTSEGAARAGSFYSEGEYDLSKLKASGRRLLELGRSCLHRDYRGGTAMFHLWNGLARYVLEREVEVLFGVASFHGTDAMALAEPLSYLYHRHLAPDDLRVRAQPGHYQSLDLMDMAEIDRHRAMLATPALIKAYLRLGGFIGDGAFIDHEFNTIDVCLLLDTARLNPRQRAMYARGAGG